MIYNRALVFIFFSLSLQAGEIQRFASSPRALLMGSAYTAIAEDEYTLFYNPAIMGRHSGLSFSLNLDLTATNVIDDQDKFENFPSSDVVGIGERLLGFPLHLHLGSVPGFKLESLGVGLIYNVTTNAILRNATHPVFNIDYHYDKGFVAGGAFSLGTGRKTDRKQARHKGSFGNGKRTSIGFGIKHIKREGIDGQFPLLGTSIAGSIANGTEDFFELRNSLGFSKGEAWGADLGFDHVHSRGRTQLSFGMAVLDIGDTKFELTEGTRSIARQKMQVNFGVALRQNFGIIDWDLSLDIGPVNQSLPFGRMFHMGIDIGLPFLRFLGGINEGYLSYGVKLNFFIFKLYAGLYSVELGNEYKEEEGKRGVLYLTLIDFSFDG